MDACPSLGVRYVRITKVGTVGFLALSGEYDPDGHTMVYLRPEYIVALLAMRCMQLWQWIQFR
jgi:hypothetical protein